MWLRLPRPALVSPASWTSAGYTVLRFRTLSEAPPCHSTRVARWPIEASQRRQRQPSCGSRRCFRAPRPSLECRPSRGWRPRRSGLAQSWRAKSATEKGKTLPIADGTNDWSSSRSGFGHPNVGGGAGKSESCPPVSCLGAMP